VRWIGLSIVLGRVKSGAILAGARRDWLCREGKLMVHGLLTINRSAYGIARIIATKLWQAVLVFCKNRRSLRSGFNEVPPGNRGSVPQKENSLPGIGKGGGLFPGIRL
jgi:hypothetical protein